MHDTPNDSNFISGIYNFCDRWCERCPLTSRCRVFAEERASPVYDDSLEIGEVVQKLTEIFAEAKQMLIDKAEELGIDPFAISDEEFAEIRERERKFVDEDDLSRLGETYWRSAKEILDGFDGEQESLYGGDPLFSEAIATLSWYLFFIPVRVKSGLHALLDEEGFEDKDHRLDPQSYANGTVKTALLAVERSIIAWKHFANIVDVGRLSSIIELLETIRAHLETRFPMARDFVRPGFDEFETVM